MPNTLKEQFEEEIRDLYDAEKQLVKALPKMAKAAKSEELRSGFEEHLEATKGHVTRLEEVFQSLDSKPKAKTCEGMKGLVAEGQKVIEESEAGELRDIGLIGAARRVEHYEIAAYQTAIKIAEAMSNESAAELMRETLSEEEETDGKLDDMCDELLESIGAGEMGEESEQRPSATGGAKTRRAG